MLRTLWRLLLGCFALSLAVPFGAMVLVLAVLSDPDLRGAFGRLGVAAVRSGVWSLVAELSPDTIVDAVTGATKALLILVALPPLLAAIVGETLRWRSSTWYWGASACLTALLPWTARAGLHLPAATNPAALPNEGRLTAILFVAGAASGLVYWLIAGWSAGRRRPPAEPELARLGPARLPEP